ncbi:MAG: SWIM zinc finger family protein [Burkholderiales bacterium]|nr:SWIM zinc finger family protein [Opitutaceae bacterium]
MAGGIDHLYRYSGASTVKSAADGPCMQFATSGGAGEFPYFFQGSLRQPRQAARLLRVLANVVASRFHLPPAMLKRILATRDPVVTCGGGMLRFEAFSACCGVYARVDLSPDAYDGVVVGQGATNVDFNADFRAALAQIRDHERVGFSVGADEVALLRGADQWVERKVRLPLRWLKGFVEVQTCQARMERRVALGKIETLRFLRSLPRSTDSRTVHHAVPTSGPGLRLTQRACPEGTEIRGLERLRILDELAPWADALELYTDPVSGATGWRLRFGPLDFHLVLSPETWRGFSGEGQALDDLASPEPTRLLSLARGALRWQAELRAEEFATDWSVPAAAVRQTLATLGTRGLVGFDLARAAYFHRELPFDLGLVEELHPRLRDARELVATDGVKLLRQNGDDREAEVRGDGVVHRVRLVGETERCTCPWHARHHGGRGPCKHILAVRIAFPTGDIDE